MRWTSHNKSKMKIFYGRIADNSNIIETNSNDYYAINIEKHHPSLGLNDWMHYIQRQFYNTMNYNNDNHNYLHNNNLQIQNKN